MNTSFKRRIAIGLILMLGLTISGCTDNDIDNVQEVGMDDEILAEDNFHEENGFVYQGDLIPMEDLVATLTHRFATDDGFEYTEPLINVPRDHTFRFDLTPEGVQAMLDRFLDDDGVVNLSDFIRVYRDSAFTQRVSVLAGGDGERFRDFTYMTVSPFRNPTFSIYDMLMGGYFFHHGEWNDWGNAQQFFLVQYYCLETAKPKERPLVTVFNVETEIPGAPRINFYVTNDGIGGLSWDPVPGATEYAVMFIEEHVDGNSTSRISQVLARTTNTYWNDVHTVLNVQNANFIRTGGFSLDAFINHFLENEGIEMADFYSVEEIIAHAREHDWNFEIDAHSDYIHHFGVIAFNSEGTSAISNLIDVRSVAPQVPMSIARRLNDGGIFTLDGIHSLLEVRYDPLLVPSHVWINMADGFPRQHLINYDINMARQLKLLDGEMGVDEYGEEYVIFESMTETPALRIPYTIEGTSFRGFIQVVEYNADTLEEDLLTLQIRQDDMRMRTGDLQRNVNLNPTEEFDGDDREGDTEDEVATHLRGDFEFFASSRLSAYLAIQMLNSQTRISLDDFPEASDHEYLVEAWFEAVLQNPLVLGARGMQLCWLTGDMLVTYDQNRNIQQRQQRAIKERVDEIVDEIITPGMTDLEKQTAINYFLIDFATYDFAALDNAAKNNFTHVDPEFFDSFTAYGILINGVGVCSGYADAFALIATRAGLESVIVTGFLQGSLPHAWNRVNIDGQWYTLDVTNNDNEFFPNAFFNLSDQEASAVLTEDTQWMLSREIPRFVATSDALAEYYRYNNRFFGPEGIVAVLVAGINENGRATYRTNVMLTEEQFQAIMLQVVLETGNTDLLGGHFLGVITIME